MRLLRWRRKREARTIGEAEAYARSYGTPSADVKVVKLPPRRPRNVEVLATGETLRRAFLDRLERRRGGEAPPQEDAEA
jgi:hypothetical protein